MSTTATVETLTAEVRVLMVGNRQVTLSVYRQLDHVKVTRIEPFGRVNAADRDKLGDEINVVGRDTRDGVLVRSAISLISVPPYFAQRPGTVGYMGDDYYRERVEVWRSLYRAWTQLPLIVLAGLR